MSLADVMAPAIRLRGQRVRRRQRARAIVDGNCVERIGQFAGADGVPARTAQPLAIGSRAQAARPRGHAALDRRDRAPRAFYYGADRRCHRGGDEARRRHHHEGRSRALHARVARADQVDVSRLHAVHDAAVVVGRNHVAETLNILESIRPSPPFGSARVRPPARLGVPARVRRSQRRSSPIRRSCRCRSSSSRARSTRASWRDDRRRIARRRRPRFAKTMREGDADDALLRGRRRTATRSRRRRRSTRCYGSGVYVRGGRLLSERRDGRFRRAAGQAEHVRARAGRSERDSAGQADAERDVADDRARSRRVSCCSSSGAAAVRRIITSDVAGDSQRARSPHDRSPTRCARRAFIIRRCRMRCTTSRTV